MLLSFLKFYFFRSLKNGRRLRAEVLARMPDVREVLKKQAAKDREGI